jgi:IS5 family transposase
MEGNSLNNALLSFVREAHSIVSKRLDDYSCKYSKKVFTQPQLVVLNLLRIREEWTYEDVEEKLEVMDTIQRELELRRVPDPSTIAKAYDRMNCWLFRWILKKSFQRVQSSGKLAVDATGFNRHWASRYYTQRTKMSLSALKVTCLADVGDPMMIRDVHITTTRKHDTKILPKLIPDDEAGSLLAADKGYDDSELRKQCRQLGIRPLIRHREHKPYDEAANARMNDDDYNQRQKIESIFSSIKQQYGDAVNSRVWFRQFRDIIATMAVYNIEQIVEDDFLLFELLLGFKRAISLR